MPFVNSTMEQDRVPMSTRPKPRRRLLTAKQMQRPRRHSRQPGSTDLNQNSVEETRVDGGEKEGATDEVVEGKGKLKEGETAEQESETRDETAKAKEPSSPAVAMYGSYIQPVPVIIVGSHYDKLDGQRAVEAVQQTQRLVDELREQFEEYLDISPQLYPLNCLKSVSAEIRALKERLCIVRSKLVEVS